MDENETAMATALATMINSMPEEMLVQCIKLYCRELEIRGKTVTLVIQ